MTVAARIVLEDCREAADQFITGIQGSQWRIIYMANVILLRTVYHVLEKRDTATDQKLREAFKSWSAELRASKPSPEIYWEFIVNERNLLLKEYMSSAGQGVTVPGVLIELNAKTKEQKATRLGEVEHHYNTISGPFIGRDQRELITEAIAWWENQLNVLDTQASTA